MESSPLQVAAGGLPVGSRSDTGPTWDQSANGSELAQLRRAAVCLLPSPGLALQQQRREDANLMLLTLLTATTSTTFFASAVIAARHAKAGLSGRSEERRVGKESRWWGLEEPCKEKV